MKKTLLFIILASAVSQAYSQVTAGLVAHYSFNAGNATDDAGSNDATVSGATLTLDRFGNANHAYYFDGINDFINLGTSTILKPGTGSISAWVKITAISNTGGGVAYNPIILAKNTSNNDSYFEGYNMSVMMGDSKLITMTTDFANLNEKYFFSSDPLGLATWYHFVMTYDNTSLKLYINGVLENSIAKGFTSTFSATEPVFLGQTGNTSNDRYFNGSIDDVRIYNRVLTVQEVGQLTEETDPAVALSETMNLQSVKSYPNPAHDFIQFSESVNVELINTAGQIVSSATQTTTLDLQQLSDGIYTLMLSNENGELMQRSKLVKH